MRTAALALALALSPTLVVPPAIAKPAAGPLILRQQVLADTGGNTRQSHSMLVPKGWQIEGGAWYASQPLFNVYPSHDIKVTAPDGRQVHLMPAVSAQDYLPSPSTGQARPAELQVSKGQPILYLPDSLDGWSQFVRDKSIRLGYPNATDIEVDTAVIDADLTRSLQQRHAFAYQSAEQQNQLSRQYGTKAHNFADARFLTVKARYTDQRQRWETLYAFGVALSGIDTPYGRQIWWTLEPAFAFKAPLGQLDPALPLLVAVAQTMRATPEWARWRTDLVNQLQRISREMAEDNRRTAANISRIISDTHAEVSSIINKGYRARNAITDRGQQRTVNAIRGTEQYVGAGVSAPVELPANYANVYSNGNGEYLLTDDRLYNPNRDPNLNGNWQPMQVRQ